MNLKVTAKRLVCAATIAVGVFAGVAGMSGQARASVSGSGLFARDNATCQAFRVFERHPSAKRFRVMLADSRSALWFLRDDVGGWQLDLRDHAAGWVLRMDGDLVTQDCADPAAQEFG